jgi:hypothetical protein
MLLLRIALTGGLAMMFAWAAIQTVQRDRFKARGGILVTRKDNPASCWTSVVLQCARATGLALAMCSLIRKWPLGSSNKPKHL